MQRDNSVRSIFILPVHEKYLLYAPMHDLSALLNGAAVSQLTRALTHHDFKLTEELEELSNILLSPPLKNPDRIGDIDPQFLGIIPSRRCNMSCVYCDFGANHSLGLVIDPDIVISAIDYFAALSEQNNKRTFSIQFFGGEPLVEQEIIDIAVHHARFIGARSGIIPHFEILTNGYFDEKQRFFIRDYFDRVVISFDGFQKYHDRNRPLNSHQGSFEKIAENIRALSGGAVEMAIRCCITSDSVHDMENMAQWFCNEFNPDVVNFETLTRNSQTDEAKIYPPDPYLFAHHCVKSWRILREYNVEPAYAPVSLDKVQTTSCPVGRDVLIVHPDGSIASCYLARKDWQEKQLDLCVGQVHKNGQIALDEKKFKLLRNPVYAKKRCEKCFCRFGCAGNCHVHCTFPDSPLEYTDFCIHTRIITACRLLEEMGQQSLAEDLLNDEKALKKLTLHNTDNLTDFTGAQ